MDVNCDLKINSQFKISICSTDKKSKSQYLVSKQSISVAKRKACLQPEKTHGYQYLFTVQFFDSYVYRSRINKGH